MRRFCKQIQTFERESATKERGLFMKILHLGDLHLGKSLGDFDLIEDQRYILNQIIGIIDEKSVKVVLIAGDVYDKQVPSEAAIKLFDWFINSLAERNVKAFIISGNHDSDDRLNYGSELFKGSGIYISAIYDGRLRRYEVQDDFCKVNIYMLPFVKASQVRHFFPKSDIKTYEDAIGVILENEEINEEEINILISHQFVAGSGEDPELGGSEGAGTKSVGLVEKIGYRMFDKFDYVALGHIHSPQRVGRDEVRYSGSPLKYSLSEVNNDKSVPVIAINGKGKMDIEFVSLKPMRNMRHIKGEMEKLLDSANVTLTDDFFYATLTDEEIINDAMGIFRQTYPNMVKIDYDNSRTKEVEYVDITEINHKKSFSELVSDFYRFIYGIEISEEEMDVMKKAAREAGVVDETE